MGIVNKRVHDRKRKKELLDKKEWYNIRSILGNTWAIFYILLGARERGKSYSVMEYCIKQWKREKKPFLWMKLNEASTKKMLTNNGAQFVDADIYRKYDLELTVKGNEVFDHGEKMATVLALSTAHNDKGVALFDADNHKGYNVVLDEFQLEKSQRRTFDIAYNLVVQLENNLRSVRHNVRVFFIGNSTEEASDILSMFNLLPQDFGIYKLVKHKEILLQYLEELKQTDYIKGNVRRNNEIARINKKYIDIAKSYGYTKSKDILTDFFGKRAVIEYIPNTESYNTRRSGAIGNILAGNTSNFTNSIKTDVSLISKARLGKPKLIIKFSKDEGDWFTVWSSNIIAKYNKEKVTSMAMKRYIDDRFDSEQVNQIYTMNDVRGFKFHNLITKKQFDYQLSLIKKQ